MKKPIFLNSIPSDYYFLHQLDVQLHNFRKFGYSDTYHVLIFITDKRPKGESTGTDISKWEELNAKYPEAKFHYYYDEEDILNKYIKPIGYIPLLRLYCLWKHFEKYPELKDEVIFYHDADILFTREFPFENYIEDNICYLSNTRGYLGLSYLDSKIDHALPHLKDELAAQIPVEKIANAAGITREVIERNDEHTGGAQYLLKNIDANFWKDCFFSCIELKKTFNSFLHYFKDSNTAYQGFCSDMWAVLYNLWKIGKITRCNQDLDFAWGTDKIERLEQVYIYHNAGITNKAMVMDGKREVMFFKGEYANNIRTPFNERDYLQAVSPKYANKFYANELLEVTNPII